MSLPRTQEELDAYLAERGVDVTAWPLPSPDQIERLRALFGYAGRTRRAS